MGSFFSGDFFPRIRYSAFVQIIYTILQQTSNCSSWNYRNGWIEYADIRRANYSDRLAKDDEVDSPDRIFVRVFVESLNIYHLIE